MLLWREGGARWGRENRISFSGKNGWGHGHAAHHDRKTVELEVGRERELTLPLSLILGALFELWAEA